MLYLKSFIVGKKKPKQYKSEKTDTYMLCLVCYSAINIYLTEMSHFTFSQNIGYPEEVSLQLQHAGG